MAALSLAIEPLRVANEITRSSALNWDVVSEDGLPVISSSNLQVTPNCALSDITETEAVLVFSGATSRFEDRTGTNGSLRQLMSRGAKLGAVSGSVFALGEERYFDGYTCSAHFCYSAALREKFDQINLTETLYTLDRNRMSFAGASSVFEYMLGVISEQISQSVAVETACWFQHATFRDPDALQVLPGHSQSRSRNHLPKQIRQAIDLFSQHLEDRLSIQDVATQIGVSLRQLERRFKEETGMSPGAYYRKMRLDEARQKLLYTDHPLHEVAISVGYDSTSAFSTNYRREFGLTPTAERKNRNPSVLADANSGGLLIT